MWIGFFFLASGPVARGAQPASQPVVLQSVVIMGTRFGAGADSLFPSTSSRRRHWRGGGGAGMKYKPALIQIEFLGIDKRLRPGGALVRPWWGPGASRLTLKLCSGAADLTWTRNARGGTRTRKWAGKTRFVDPPGTPFTRLRFPGFFLRAVLTVPGRRRSSGVPAAGMG